MKDNKMESNIMNKIISIGWMGEQRVYLNTPRDEAIKKFANSESNYQHCSEAEISDHYTITEFEFENEFYVYDIWENI
jgi:hypothetical protein